MDIKYEVSRFIRHICNWIEYEYIDKGHVAFQYDFNNDKMAYVVVDKGIERRIQKELHKRLGLNSVVTYTLLPQNNICLYGELRVRLYKRNEYI